jgi:hypothetical protein
MNVEQYSQEQLFRGGVTTSFNNTFPEEFLNFLFLSPTPISQSYLVGHLKCVNIKQRLALIPFNKSESNIQSGVRRLQTKTCNTIPILLPYISKSTLEKYHIQIDERGNISIGIFLFGLNYRFLFEQFMLDMLKAYNQYTRYKQQLGSNLPQSLSASSNGANIQMVTQKRTHTTSNLLPNSNDVAIFLLRIATDAILTEKDRASITKTCEILTQNPQHF